MRDGRSRVCIATDVAARGIDLPNLDLVIHADLPKNREGLLHRSGRTGRAGRKGTSVLIVPVKAQKRADRLLRSASVSAVWDLPPSIKDILKRDEERLLGDPAITDKMSDNEAAFCQNLSGKIWARANGGRFCAALPRGPICARRINRCFQTISRQKEHTRRF